MIRVSPLTKAVLAWVATLSILSAASTVLYLNQEPERDSTNLCAPSLEAGHTIVFVDKTDLWNEAQANRLEGHIWWLVTRKMQTEERLSIFPFNDQFKSGFEPRFSFCKPPSGADANDLTKSKDYYNRQYKKQFIEPLRATLEDIKKAEEKDCSPIIEVIFDVLTRSEIRERKGQTRLVIISDLAQNSGLFSFYIRSKCRAGRGGPGSDTSDISSFITQRAYAINDKEFSVVIFQVLPEKNPPYVTNGVKDTWNAFFSYFGIKPDWQLL